MNLPGALCLSLIVSFVSGTVDQGSCIGDSCEVSDWSALLQSGVGLVDAIEASSEELADAQVVDDNADFSISGGGPEDTDVECSSFTNGSTCQVAGCSWSGAFVGELKEDGSELTEYICADEEEVEEEVHDKLMNGTGSLIQMLQDGGEITSKGNEGRWCRRRRAGGGSCPYCRRRRTPPPPPAKIEANGCPTGYSECGTGDKCKCPGSGKCCKAGWSASCGQGCAQQKCTSTGGSWITVDLNANPYTCEMPKAPSTPSKYCDAPKADNAGFDCLCETGTGYCGLSKTWHGTLASAKAKCDGDAECKYLHDWKADGAGWRACRKINSPGDSKAAIKTKSTSGSCAVQTPSQTDALTGGSGTPKVAPSVKVVFDSVDGDDSGGISRAELQKAIDAGTVVEGTAAPTAKPPSSGTTAPSTNSPGTAAPTTKPPSSGGLTQSQKDAIVQKHNTLRAGLGASDMMKMVWDDTLANAAQQYVSGVSLLAQESNISSQKCPKGHSQNRPNTVGENLAWKWSSTFRLADIVTTDFTPSVQSWYDEIKDAGPYTTGGAFSGFGECTGMCGHYTQVVWAAANKIGCGAAFCPHSTGMGGYELVCQYGTSVPGGFGGNMGGATLFTQGTACSQCPSNSGTCSSNLCA